MKKEKVVLLFRSSLFELSGEMMNGIYSYAKEHQWRVQMVEHGAALRDSWKNSPDEPVSNIVRRALEFWNPDGCIVELGTESIKYEQLMFDGVPTVFLDRSPKEIGEDRLCVSSDSAAIASCAARELLAFDWPNAAYVPSPAAQNVWSRERGLEFGSLMRNAGKRVAVFSVKATGWTDQVFLDALYEWICALPLPCTLFAANDLIGRQVLAMAKKAGVDVPRQLAVVSVDNEVRICEHTVPTLSSIRQDMFVAGYQAARLLDERLRHPRKRLESVRFGAAELVRRASSSRCAQFDARVLSALEYIRLHACEGISSADVAAQFSCSRRFLDRIFGQSVGRSILDEIQRVKVEAVKGLLRKNSSAKQVVVADRCGFTSPEDMRRVFKKVEGRTIGDFLDS